MPIHPDDVPTLDENQTLEQRVFNDLLRDLAKAEFLEENVVRLRARLANPGPIPDTAEQRALLDEGIATKTAEANKKRADYAAKAAAYAAMTGRPVEEVLAGMPGGQHTASNLEGSEGWPVTPVTSQDENAFAPSSDVKKRGK